MPWIQNRTCCQNQDNLPRLTDWLHTDRRVLLGLESPKRAILSAPVDNRFVLQGRCYILRNIRFATNRIASIMVPATFTGDPWRWNPDALEKLAELLPEYGEKLAAIEVVYPGTLTKLAGIMELDWRTMVLLPEDFEA